MLQQSATGHGQTHAVADQGVHRIGVGTVPHDGRVYALLVYYRETEADEASMPPAALDAWMGWYDSTPDAPCIAICSTSQGDELCKGCGRTFDEVQHWPVMTPTEKRVTWRRISLEATAWRFNRYAERARESKGIDHPQANA